MYLPKLRDNDGLLSGLLPIKNLKTRK